MIDWISSKVMLGLVSILIIASVAGTFEYFKEVNSEDALENALTGFVHELWELNRSGVGTTITVSPGDQLIPNTVMDESVTIYIYNGLLIGRAGDSSVRFSIPRVDDIDSDPIVIIGKTTFTKTVSGLKVASQQVYYIS